ncbi:hypothetical protein D3C80_1777510 [compost metagenome]
MMVFELRGARKRDGTDTTHIEQVDGECATVGGIVTYAEAISLLQRHLPLLQA